MTNEHTEFKDWLAEVITDSLDMDWSSTDAARLIVERLDEQPVYDAAPDLLEALKPFAAMAAAYDPEDGDGEQEAWAFNARPTIGQLRKARAAINRAEGRS